MSGNPFRTSPAPKHPAAAAPPPTTSFTTSRGGAEVLNLSDAAGLNTAASAAPAPPKTKKSVRINSPTETVPPHPAFENTYDERSPLQQRESYASYAVGVPLPSSSSTAGFLDNKLGGVDAGLYGRREEIEGGMRRNMDVPEAMQSPSGAPANPFSKTLATIEPYERGVSGELVGQQQQVRDRPTAERTTSGTTKPSLDVEGFKNMLMTGISSPKGSGPAPAGPAPVPQVAPALAPPNPPVFESSSSTDTSSLSRQSIIEPLQEPHQETPRTSYEMAASDEDRSSLMGELKKEKKKPPPAPKHRHGKSVVSRTPQTVSFDDFKPMEPTASPPTVRRQSSDLSKTLPATPLALPQPSHIVSQDSTHEAPSIPEDRTSDITSPSENVPVHKKTPPPVPLARRHSQLRTSMTGNRSRSNSSLTMSSQHSNDFAIPSPAIALESAASPPAQKVPPPPPPTRHRGAALSTISTSSANSSTTELSATPAPRKSTLSSPNPPPTRRSLPSEPSSPAGLARTSSISSTRNTQRAVSNESSTSANMPPPPPPPRKRTSGGRASLDKDRPSSSIFLPTSPTTETTRRPSAENKRNSVDSSKRRTSVASESSLKYEYAPADGESALYSPREEEGETQFDALPTKGSDANANNAGNILDDMEKFQKEIEELREKYRHAA